tara:strand:+ start:552 stop:2135 length:1584 start_codon:yes stop_codon:yes gene_type:complete
MLNIAIRVDSATDIGTGHVMRCLTLADRLKQQSNILFVCKSHSGHIGALIEEKGYAIAWLTCQENDTQAALHHASWLGGSQQDDAEQTLNALSQHFDAPVDWVIVDHYALDKTWEHCFKHTRVFVIDDLGDRKHHADILLDQNLQASAEKYQHLVNPECTLLLGLKYALLRQEFYISEQEIILRRQSGKIERILVMFGGIDPDNLTQQIVDELVRVPEIKHIDVIVTKNAAHLAALQAQNTLHQQVQLHVSPEHIAKLMLQADLAVGAGGSTSWERCMLALPTITFCQAYNQQESIRLLQKNNLISVLPKDRLNDLKIHIQNWMQSKVYQRSVTQCLKLTYREPFPYQYYLKSKRPRLKIEYATQDDCIDILNWRNDPISRHNSNHPEPIKLNYHQSWYQQALKSPDKSFFIAKKDTNKIGMVRFDRLSSHQAEVSINLNPQFRGKGLSQSILQLSLVRYFEDQPQITQIQAQIKSSNQSSLSLFKACCFTYKESKANFQKFELNRSYVINMFTPQPKQESYENELA